MSALLVALCLGLTYIATRTTYWIFKVFVGFIWWALAFYWNTLPITTDASLRTILVLLPIGIGIGCLFWGFWQNGIKDKYGNESGRFRLPFHRDEDDDEPEPTRVDRMNNYSDRIRHAQNGNRQRRG
jgi:hypothetical protein